VPRQEVGLYLHADVAAITQAFIEPMRSCSQVDSLCPHKKTAKPLSIELMAFHLSILPLIFLLGWVNRAVAYLPVKSA
jgi:hypothetical protein